MLFHRGAKRFAERLPIEKRGHSIVALQAEDHYLRGDFADRQSTLILLRISDAIAELPSDNGAQTHRSWWVAQQFIRSVDKLDGRATLTLENHIQAPVSRTYFKTLNSTGWFD